MNEVAQQSFSPYFVSLDVFEGPLDLLLHLIKENNVDIFNIPISKITDQYVEYINTMQSLNLNIAGEFLLMASTLAHLKSKLLLPPDPTDEEDLEEGKDPREELVRRLLEYQKYKNAAQTIENQDQLGRDVFVRITSKRKIQQEDSIELAEISIFKLVESFHKILNELQINKAHDVEVENFSVSECAVKIQQKLQSFQGGKVKFADLFEKDKTQSYGEVVATFLAILSMIKRGVIKVFQSEDFEDIYLTPTEQFHIKGWTYDGTEFDEKH